MVNETSQAMNRGRLTDNDHLAEKDYLDRVSSRLGTKQDCRRGQYSAYYDEMHDEVKMRT